MSTRVYAPPTSSFKAERVQLNAEAAPACPAAEPLVEQLKDLPGWRLTAQQDALYRHFRFPAPGSAQLFARLALTLADEVGHPPTLNVKGARVTCRLSTPWAGGITARDFEMARRLSLLN